MENTILKVVQIDIGLVHPTVLSTLLDVEFLHQLPVLFASFAFPDFLKRLVVKIANTELLIEKVRGTSEYIAIRHRIYPEEWSRPAPIVMVRLALLLNRILPVDDLKRGCRELPDCFQFIVHLLIIDFSLNDRERPLGIGLHHKVIRPCISRQVSKVPHFHEVLG